MNKCIRLRKLPKAVDTSYGTAGTGGGSWGARENPINMGTGDTAPLPPLRYVPHYKEWEVWVVLVVVLKTSTPGWEPRCCCCCLVSAVL
jgi:hypothetical protein